MALLQKVLTTLGANSKVFSAFFTTDVANAFIAGINSAASQGQAWASRLVGGGGGGTLRSGSLAIAQGTTQVQIVFDPAFSATPLAPACALQKAQSSDASIYVQDVFNVTVNGCTVQLSAATPNANYTLSWYTTASSSVQMTYDCASLKNVWRSVRQPGPVYSTFTDDPPTGYQNCKACIRFIQIQNGAVVNTYCGSATAAASAQAVTQSQKTGIVADSSGYIFYALEYYGFKLSRTSTAASRHPTTTKTSNAMAAGKVAATGSTHFISNSNNFTLTRLKFA